MVPVYKTVNELEGRWDLFQKCLNRDQFSPNPEEKLRTHRHFSSRIICAYTIEFGTFHTWEFGELAQWAAESNDLKIQKEGLLRICCPLFLCSKLHLFEDEQAQPLYLLIRLGGQLANIQF